MKLAMSWGVAYPSEGLPIVHVSVLYCQVEMSCRAPGLPGHQGSQVACSNRSQVGAA